MSHPHAPTAAAARVQRIKTICLAAPPVASLLAAIIGLAAASVRFGSPPSAGACFLFPLLGAGAGLVVTLVMRLAFSRSTIASLFWPALLGSLVCAGITFAGSRTQTSAGGAIGSALYFNLIVAAGLGSLAGCVGVLLGLVPWLQFTLRCERIAAGACARCGYSLTGLASRECPECGAQI